MILFVLLAMILIGLVIFTLVTVSAIGAGGIIIFSDVIVCIAIIAFIMRLLVKKKH